MQTVNDIPFRQQEESRIVLKWLNRLKECVRSEPGNLFSEAIDRSGLSRQEICSGEGLALEHFDRVMEILGRRVPDLTFRFFSDMELLDLGMIGYAILSSTTVKKGLGLMARFLELTSDRFTEKHHAEQSCYVIQPSPTWRHLGEDVSIAEDCIAGNWRAIKLMLGPEADLYGACVRFAYSAPETAKVYEHYFAPCRVVFDAGKSELRIPADWLDRPVTTANLVMSDVTREVCDRLLGPGVTRKSDTPRMVRRLLISRPGQHMLRLEEAADELQMSTSQLRKRLYRAGTSYKNLVLEIRMDLASHYLETTQLKIHEIAELLDYGQPGPFSRAFKKYHGRSPRTIREISTVPVSV